MIITNQLKLKLGNMIAGVKDDKLCIFDFEFRKMMPAIKNRVCSYHNDEMQEGEHELFDILVIQINEYFLGNRFDFDLPITFSGTEFQQRVWNELLNIPFGSTRTYMQQAKALGDEKAIRAVAKANGENCLAIIVPCHRIVGSDGSLTGYAGGLNTKKSLLEHEAKRSGKAIQAIMF